MRSLPIAGFRMAAGRKGLGLKVIGLIVDLWPMQLLRGLGRSNYAAMRLIHLARNASSFLNPAP